MTDTLPTTQHNEDLPPQNHPEQRPGEVLLTNWDRNNSKGPDITGYQNIRSGSIAYDESGQEIQDHFPVFVPLAEYNIVNKETKIGH